MTKKILFLILLSLVLSICTSVVCFANNESETVKLIKEYVATGDLLTKGTLPENLRWILDVFIHSFNIETDTSVLTNEADAKCCIVPPWHPATLQKLVDQKNFFLDGCLEWWNENGAQGLGSKSGINYVINNR